MLYKKNLSKRCFVEESVDLVYFTHKIFNPIIRPQCHKKSFNNLTNVSIAIQSTILQRFYF